MPKTQHPIPGSQPIRLAMLASGSGTNVENFIRYFRDHPVIEVALVVSDRKDALVLERARRHGIPRVHVPGSDWKDPGRIINLLSDQGIDCLVLAGFLRLVPPPVVKAWPDRIVNIHPALLPDFGGKGMYGMHVHQAVIASGAAESGISIHLVNERYDEGQVLFQARLPVEAGETPESLAGKIHALEYRYYPAVVESWLTEGKRPGS